MVIQNARVEFAGGGQARQAHESVRGPGVDARSLPSWGIYARNVEKLTLEDVRLRLATDDFRPVISANGVKELTLDNFKFTRVPGVAPAMLTNVTQVNWPEQPVLNPP